MVRKITIYLVRCFANGKVYIGQTSKTCVERWLRHVSEAMSHQDGSVLLYRGIRKYGVCAFGVRELEITFTKHAADQLEAHYIQMFRATECDFGYNIKPGGRTLIGYKHTAKTRKKMQQAQLRFWTPEQRRKKSLQMMGKCNAAGKRSAKAVSNILAGSRRRWRDPEAHVRHSKALSRPEVRERRSIALRAALARPEVKAKMLGNQNARRK